MAKKEKEDAFSALDPLLAAADASISPWQHGRYVPDLDLLRDLLTQPIAAGDKQESGDWQAAPTCGTEACCARPRRGAARHRGGLHPR